MHLAASFLRVAAHCGPKEGETVYFVPLEVMGNSTDDVIQLLSSEVYSFMSSSSQQTLEEGGIGGSNSPLVVPPVGESAMSVVEVVRSKGDSSAAPVTTSTSLRASATCSAPTSSSPLQVAGSAHLVGAVKDLLSAAGLPLDLERVQLLQQAATWKEALAQAQQQLSKVCVGGG
jgi:hypothetical protein